MQKETKKNPDLLRILTTAFAVKNKVGTFSVREIVPIFLTAIRQCVDGLVSNAVNGVAPKMPTIKKGRMGFKAAMRRQKTFRRTIRQAVNLAAWTEVDSFADDLCTEIAEKFFEEVSKSNAEDPVKQACKHAKSVLIVFLQKPLNIAAQSAYAECSASTESNKLQSKWTRVSRGKRMSNSIRKMHLADKRGGI